MQICINLHWQRGGCTKIKLMQKTPSSGILHQLHQNYYKNFKICYKEHEIDFKKMKFVIKNIKFSIKKIRFSVKNMKFSIKNMIFSIKNMKFSVYEVYQNSSFALFVTEFSYHVIEKMLLKPCKFNIFNSKLNLLAKYVQCCQI